MIDDSTTCAVVSSESKWVVSRQLMVLSSCYCPDLSINFSATLEASWFGIRYLSVHFVQKFVTTRTNVFPRWFRENARICTRRGVPSMHRLTYRSIVNLSSFPNTWIHTHDKFWLIKFVVLTSIEPYRSKCFLTPLCLVVVWSVPPLAGSLENDLVLSSGSPFLFPSSA